MEETEQHEHGEHHHQIENQLCPCHRHSWIAGQLYGSQSEHQEGKKKQHAQDVEARFASATRLAVFCILMLATNAVVVVPMFAPITIGIAAVTGIRFCCTSRMQSPVVMLLDWTIAVIKRRAITLARGLLDRL